jgi:hypothetical protein
MIDFHSSTRNDKACLFHHSLPSVQLTSVKDKPSNEGDKYLKGLLHLYRKPQNFSLQENFRYFTLNYIQPSILLKNTIQNIFHHFTRGIKLNTKD